MSNLYVYFIPAQPQLNAQQAQPTTPVLATETTTIATPRYELNTQPTQQAPVDLDDVALQPQEDLGKENMFRTLDSFLTCEVWLLVGFEATVVRGS